MGGLCPQLRCRGANCTCRLGAAHLGCHPHASLDFFPDFPEAEAEVQRGA